MERSPSSVAESSNPRVPGFLFVFILLGIVLVGTIAVTFVSGNAATQATRTVYSDQAVIDDLRETLSTLKDAETGERGYVITGDVSYLAPHAIAKEQFRGEIKKLEARVRSGDLSAEDVAHYRELSDAKFKELDRAIQVRRESGFEAGAAVVRENTGKELMDALRALTDRMVRRTAAELAESSARAEWLYRIRRLIFLGTTVVNLGFLFWAYRRITRESRLRAAAANEMARQRKLLSVTLASIGDGVIITDTETRITFVNAVAEALTGWEAADALGKPCNEVFKIINETSRQKVECPVEKVIRLGTIIGLANHTILIRKDGTEIPIDDSGAPIREEDGTLRGVVLVFRDFSDHKAAELTVRQALEDAQAATIAKDNFLATLSHELRTPLTPVVMTLESWLTHSDLPAAYRTDVEMMRRNLDLEARLIDDLLDLTRIVRGKLSLNFVIADANSLIEAMAGMCRSEIQAKGLHLSLDLAAAQHYVNADPARLQQVFLNILKNATKFTPSGGTVTIETRNDERGHLRIAIRDSGFGMAQETLDKLFQPFEQGSDDMVKHYGGLGLGMAISKALVEALGGSIEAESEGLGRGSTFSVALPVREPAETPDPATRSPAEDLQRPMTVLLVEDHGDTARALSRLLERWGNSVTVVETVAAALREHGEKKFDLILSDIGLPDGSGLDLIKAVRKSSDVPAVALTGFGMDEDIHACTAAGFNDHLTKPINFQKLEMIIQRIGRKAG